MSGASDNQQVLGDVMSNHPGLPKWPRYDAETRATMVFDNKSLVVNNPRGKERAVLDSVR